MSATDLSFQKEREASLGKQASLEAVHVERSETHLKLDKYGVPLVPQPSDSPDDPLNWPYWTKVYNAVLVSTLAFLGQMGAALISPAFVPMAKELHVTVQQASYAVTTYIIVAGVCPMFLIPFTSIYGRRPFYIIFGLLAVAANIGSGAATSFAGQQVCRALYGLGCGIPLALAPATIADMFVLGQRGLWMGLYVLMVNNGPHIGPIIGGWVALKVSWRWCYYLPGILLGAVWLVSIFTLRETLYSRTNPEEFREPQGYVKSHFTVSKIRDRSLKGSDFVKPFYMARYAAVLFPAIFFGTSNLFGSVLFTVTMADITRSLYKYNPGQTGLLLGVPLTIGCMIGEASSGWVSDWLTNLHAKKTGKHKPESRLWLAPFALLTAIGTMGYGWAVEAKESWPKLAVCLAISGCGVQFGSTCVYTYVTDSYKPQSPECGALLNLMKSLFAFTSAYYALPFSHKAGFGVAFTVFACANLASLLPLFVLLVFGEKVRAKQGEPQFHRDL